MPLIFSKSLMKRKQLWGKALVFSYFKLTINHYIYVVLQNCQSKKNVRDHFFNIKPFWLLKIARWNTFVIVVRAYVAVNKQFWTFDVQANYGSTLLANLYGSWRKLTQNLKKSESFVLFHFQRNCENSSFIVQR